jgi:hypothetical protein
MLHQRPVAVNAKLPECAVKMPHWLLVVDIAAAIVLVVVIIDPMRVLQPLFGLLVLVVVGYIAWRFWKSRR